MRFLPVLLLAAAAHAADFPEPTNNEKTPGGPLSPTEAVAAVKTPPGFKVTMFAAEPDVQQPIAMATDSRGRLWVAECYTYGDRSVNFDLKLRDRILIFEDTDNDGHFDKRTVFWDEGQRLTSIEIGNGGVYALCAPQLLFIPDRDHDDKPDGVPEVLLDGWDGGQVRHNIVNGLRWGPDGWLYGRHGIQATSRVGAPGTPDARRTPVTCSIWRYHPTRKTFEVVCTGTTNSWGMDWDAKGEAFFINTVIGHMWHVMPGAHYRRMYGEDANPHVYQLLDQIADHYHFDTGAGWTKSRPGPDGLPIGVNDTLGGGHAHSGCVIYQGEQWPEYWRGKLLTINFHGRRLNVERLEHNGSSYVAKHEPDAFFFGDPWFRGVELLQAPDGGVFVADWSDAGECHDNDGIHRTSGRIYKITYGEPKLPSQLAGKGETPGNLAVLPDKELVQLQESHNEWLVRQARRALIDRSPAKADADQNQKDAAWYIDRALAKEPSAETKLPLLWLRNILKPLNARSLPLRDPDDAIRSWAIRFGIENGSHLALADAVSGETSPAVLRVYAESLGHLDGPVQSLIVKTLLAKPELASDGTLPVLLWQQVASSPNFSLASISELAAEAKWPLFQRFAARRLSADPAGAGPLAELLRRAVKNGSPEFAASVVTGISEGLRGIRKTKAPEGWADFTTAFKARLSDSQAARLRELEVVFGDGIALDEIRKIALDDKVEPPARRQALLSLIEARPPELRTVCETLLKVKELSGVAVRGLALFDDPAVGQMLVSKYKDLGTEDKATTIGALVSRPVFAQALLTAIGKGTIPRGDLSAFHARQIRSFGDEALSKQLAESWGEIRSTDEAKKALIAKLSSQLKPEMIARADLGAGRAVFAQVCASCHKMYGAGGDVGPDLTGSNRDNLAYLLENIADPSGVVPVDYRMSIVTMKDGRVLSGVLGAKAERTVNLRTIAGIEALDRTEIAKIEDLPQSLMPEGLLLALNETQVRDLIGYLMSKSQVPLPGEK